MAQFGNMTAYDYSALRLVLFAGEVFPVKYLRILKQIWAGPRYFNLYGPTETNVCTFYEIPAEIPNMRSEPYPIGKTCAHLQTLVLGDDGVPAAPGAEGELLVSGASVMAGYWHLPERTATAFYTDAAGIAWYKTGDLVRVDASGDFIFLGRRDRMVKRRGYRIELGEIEAVLRRETAVQDTLVLARDAAGAGPQLVAYVVGSEISVVDLREALSQKLPGYMVPAAFVLLDAFPLTPNGKIDRKALPAPMAVATAAFVAPRNDVEIIIANLWADTLKLPQVGIHDNFFELGGHSLLATQMVTRLRQTLRIALPLRALFDAPTVAELTNVVLQSPNERARVEKVAQLLIKLSQLSDEEAAKLLSQKR